jgi:glycosyltransferase involved in cell wall biosynthesis
VKKDSKKLHSVTIIISNASISPQLLEVIKCLRDNQINQKVLVISDGDNPLLAKIRRLNVSLKVLKSTSKYGIIGQSLLFLFYLLKHRPTTLLASGQFATFIGMPAAFLLRIRNRVYIRHHSNFHHKYNLRVGLTLDRVMNRFSTKIVAVSQIVKDVLVQKEGVNDNKVIIIYNGIELKLFQSKPIEQLSKDNVFRIGVISRLTEWKGVVYTAKAFKEFVSLHPNSYLHIIGARADDFNQVSLALEGVPKEKYQIEPLNLDIPGFLHSIDVFVHVPLEIDDEAFGIVYVEALASGTPGIFTISGVLNELTNPDLYFSVVLPRDQRAILAELERHYNRTATYESVPVDWLKQFDLQNQGLSYLKLVTS